MEQSFNEHTSVEHAIARVQPCEDPRMKQVLEALIRHSHSFVKEVEPTEGEWIGALNFMRSIGAKCEERGNLSECVLFSDVLGVSSLVENIAHRKPQEATTSTVLGPFHVAGAPVLPNGTDIAGHKERHPNAEPMFMSGRCLDQAGNPIQGAVLDVWHADEEGQPDRTVMHC
jgi:hydroxyquinol 1,2-dioxygenase